MWFSLEETLYSILDVGSLSFPALGDFLIQLICFIVCGAVIMLPFIIIYKIVDIISEGVK